MSVDKNKTVWQRIQAALEPSEGRAEADRLATLLLPTARAERNSAMLDLSSNIIRDLNNKYP